MLSYLQFPSGSAVENPACNTEDIRDVSSIPGLGRSQEGVSTTPVFLLKESHGQRCLEGYSPYSCKESDMTEAT